MFIGGRNITFFGGSFVFSGFLVSSIFFDMFCIGFSLFELGFSCLFTFLFVFRRGIYIIVF